MNLDQAKEVLLRTHLAALQRGVRAPAYVMEALPGVGKSDGNFQYGAALAAALNEPVGLVVFMATTITSPDARGFMMPIKPEPGKRMQTEFSIPPWYPSRKNMYVVEPLERSEGDGTGVRWWAEGTWPEDRKLPRIGIEFLDEWGQGDEDVKKPLAELILHGSVGTTHLPIGWRVVCAQNRMSDRSGTVREMMFIVNRRGLLKIEPSLPTWLKWANSRPESERPHYMTLSFAQQHPDVVFRDKVPDSPDPFCTPRSLCVMDWELRALGDGDQLPMDEIAREVCAGRIGEGAAGHFMAHLKYADRLPTIEDIEDDPVKAKLPAGRDAQMVAAYMLAHHVNEDNAKNIMRYVLRLEEEMQILAVQVITNDIRRRKFLVPLREYDLWLTKNASRLAAAQS